MCIVISPLIHKKSVLFKYVFYARCPPRQIGLATPLWIVNIASSLATNKYRTSFQYQEMHEATISETKFGHCEGLHRSTK